MRQNYWLIQLYGRIIINYYNYYCFNINGKEDTITAYHLPIQWKNWTYLLFNPNVVVVGEGGILSPPLLPPIPPFFFFGFPLITQKRYKL